VVVVVVAVVDVCVLVGEWESCFRSVLILDMSEGMRTHAFMRFGVAERLFFWYRETREGIHSEPFIGTRVGHMVWPREPHPFPLRGST